MESQSILHGLTRIVWKLPYNLCFSSFCSEWVGNTFALSKTILTVQVVDRTATMSFILHLA